MNKPIIGILFIAISFGSLNLYAQAATQALRNATVAAPKTTTIKPSANQSLNTMLNRGIIKAPKTGTTNVYNSLKDSIGTASGKLKVKLNETSNSPVQPHSSAAGIAAVINGSKLAASPKADVDQAKTIFRDMANNGNVRAGKLLQILSKSKLSASQVTLLVTIAFAMTSGESCSTNGCTEADIDKALTKAGISPDEVDACEIAA